MDVDPIVLHPWTSSGGMRVHVPLALARRVERVEISWSVSGSEWTAHVDGDGERIAVDYFYGPRAVGRSTTH